MDAEQERAAGELDRARDELAALLTESWWPRGWRGLWLGCGLVLGGLGVLLGAAGLQGVRRGVGDADLVWMGCVAATLGAALGVPGARWIRARGEALRGAVRAHRVAGKAAGGRGGGRVLWRRVLPGLLGWVVWWAVAVGPAMWLLR